MVPSFGEQLDRNIEAEELGTVHIDTAFGGGFYAPVEVAQLGLEIKPGSPRALAHLGNRIRLATREQCHLRHPEFPSLNEFMYTMFAAGVPG